jgi:hypothetical protein
MSAFQSALKNKMQGPPMANDPAAMSAQPDKAPVLSPPQGASPMQALSPAGQQLPPEILAVLLQALMGHGGPLAQKAASKGKSKPAEGSPQEEAAESPAKEKKEMSAKKKPFGKF